MKKLKLSTVIFLLTTILFLSCKEKKPTQDEIVKKNIEGKLIPKMNDPKSYEFVELKLIDSVLYIDNINYRKKYFKDLISYDKNHLKQIEEYKTKLPSLYDDKEVNDLKEKIKQNELIIKKIDSLEKKLDNKINNVASYTYKFSFRGNNALGAKILKEYIVQTKPAPGLEIINMTDDKDKVYLNPNDFPGYREMIKKMK